MRKLILLLLVCTSSKSFSATITIFPEGNGQCRYILVNDEARQIATWTHDCLADFHEVKAVDIVKNTPLWKALKKLHTGTRLRDIKLHFTKDGPTIEELKSLSVPEIDAGRTSMSRSLREHEPSPKKRQSEDYNSSRSNKANSLAPAQDYNSSRSNKANSLAPAQDYNSSRSNKAGVMLAFGLTWPHQTEYLKQGVTIRGAYHIPLTGGWGVDAGVDFYSNPFVYKPSPYLPEKYRLALESGISNDKWSQIAISGGPSFTKGCGKFGATAYAMAGVLFSGGPDQTIGGDQPVARFSGNSTSFVLDPGLRLNYSLGSSTGIFFDADFLTSLKPNISYSEKDAFRASGPDGEFNQDTYASLALEQREMGMHLWGLSAGVKINF